MQTPPPRNPMRDLYKNFQPLPPDASPVVELPAQPPASLPLPQPGLAQPTPDAAVQSATPPSPAGLPVTQPDEAQAAAGAAARPASPPFQTHPLQAAAARQAPALTPRQLRAAHKAAEKAARKTVRQAARSRSQPRSAASRWGVIILFAVLLATSLFALWSLLSATEAQSNVEFTQLGQPWSRENPFPARQGKSEVAMLVIHNSTDRLHSYKIEARLAADQQAPLAGAAGPYSVASQDTIYVAVEFMPGPSAGLVPLQLLLFRGDNTQQPYRELQVWLKVQPAE